MDLEIHTNQYMKQQIDQFGLGSLCRSCTWIQNSESNGALLERLLGCPRNLVNGYLEPQTTIYKWMFDETTISYVKIGNHPIETTIYKQMFQVPGSKWFGGFYPSWKHPFIIPSFPCPFVLTFGAAHRSAVEYNGSRHILKLETLQFKFKGGIECLWLITIHFKRMEMMHEFVASSDAVSK